MIKELVIGIRSTIVLWLITALIYPLLILVIGQGVFPQQANGSLVQNNQGIVVGSVLIGQNFSSEKYFWSRPSTTNYSQGKDVETTGLSGASNLAPSNPDLLKRVKETVAQLQSANLQPTADLVYTSGSSLDPHISLEAAQAQIGRVAQIRSVDTNQIELLVVNNTEGRFLGIFGEPGVNVLKLNMALDLLPNNK